MPGLTSPQKKEMTAGWAGGHLNTDRKNYIPFGFGPN